MANEALSVALSHVAIICLVILHDMWLPRSLRGLWPRTTIGKLFPVPSGGGLDERVRKQFEAALLDARFLVTISSQRLLAFVTLVLMIGRQDAFGYALSVVALFPIFWLFTAADSLEVGEFFGKTEGGRLAGESDQDTPKTKRSMSPNVICRTIVVFLNAIPLLLLLGEVIGVGGPAADSSGTP